MKKALRAAALTMVLFAGANAQAIRQSETDDQRVVASATTGECYYVNGQWVCIK